MGALTTRGRLSIFSCVDANTYDIELVREWTEEVKDAALVFLGGRLAEEDVQEKQPARTQARL